MWQKGKHIQAHSLGKGGRPEPAKPPAPRGEMNRDKKPPEAPHGKDGEKHVTETHPGKTQPHPHTGVHAFVAHHTGGGKYTSHTHHDGGDVETRQHGNEADMHTAMKEALPDTGQQSDETSDMRGGNEEFAEQLGGVGGEMGEQA